MNQGKIIRPSAVNNNFLISTLAAFILSAACLANVFAAGEPDPAKTAASPLGAPQGPREVVMAYVAAANSNDLDAFIALYAPDIRKYKFPATLASEGREHMREVYTRSFKEKSGIHVDVKSMMVLGNKVVSQDRVTGLPNGDTVDELAVYQVDNGLITNIVYVERVVTPRIAGSDGSKPKT